jgi:hypothetical protein
LAQVEYNVLTWQLPVPAALEIMPFPEAERVAELSKHILGIRSALRAVLNNATRRDDVGEDKTA